jgi:hypothetical protein
MSVSDIFFLDIPGTEHSMKFDPKKRPEPAGSEDDRPRFIKPRAFDGASFPGWGPKLR